MTGNFFEGMLHYLSAPGAHLRSTEASEILMGMLVSSRGSFPQPSSKQERLTENYELVTAMGNCVGTPDAGLMDDLLLFSLNGHSKPQ